MGLRIDENDTPSVIANMLDELAVSPGLGSYWPSESTPRM